MASEIYELIVSDIVEKYKPVYPQGGTWQDTVGYLYSQDRKFMDELFEAIRTEGIREPITLADDDDEDGLYVLNGTHRVAIALYHGLVTLPARYGYEEYDSNELRLAAKIKLSDGGSLTQDEDDTLTDKLRSWRLDEKTWLTSDIIYGGSNEWELYLDHSDISLKPKLEKRIRSILKSLFPNRAFSVTVDFEEPIFDEEG